VEVIFSALSVKQHYIHGLGQPLALIQQWDNLMNTLLKMQERYGSDYIQVVYHSANSVW
jgi:DNA polymerase V